MLHKIKKISKDIYKDIILTKQILFISCAKHIIENELIKDNNEILQLFEVLRKLIMTKNKI